jgi:hypothetical protein
MTQDRPECKVCGGSNGVQFNVFTSAFPFGECCVECESRINDATHGQASFCKLLDDGCVVLTTARGDVPVTLAS